MADRKITDLDAVTTLADADLLTAVTDVATTPENKKITVANFKTTIDTGITHTHAVFVSKEGNDSNNGTRFNQPKLTIGSALTQAATLITGGATGVRVWVVDGGTYTENITVPTSISVDAKGATLVGTASITGGSELFVDRHFATANNQAMLTCEGAGDGPAIYWANISDGRGTGGALTGTSNLRNTGGGGKNLFARVGTMFVAASGTGVGDVSIGDAGHIHIEILDLYLAGNNAIGILGSTVGTGSTNVVGWIDHILEAGTPTGTVGISMTAAAAVVKLVASEIVADTAYSITNGSLYLSCPKITGIQTGTPAQKMVGTVELANYVDYSLVSEASSATPTATGTALKNDYVATALAENATLAAPSGTANANATIRYRITASGGTRTIGYNAGLLAGNITRTTSLATGETLTQIYQRVGSTWVCMLDEITS